MKFNWYFSSLKHWHISRQLITCIVFPWTSLNLTWDALSLKDLYSNFKYFLFPERSDKSYLMFPKEVCTMRSRRKEDLRVGVHTCNTEQKWFRWKKMEELKLKVFREKQSREFVCEYCQGRSNFFLKIFNAKQQHFHYCLILRFHYILL